MTEVAVLAHAGKTIGGGLPELRRLLREQGVTNPLWREVPKSKKAPKQAKALLDAGADVILVWGGDGMVQRVVDAVAGSGVTLGILPAGTANLFANNLGIPIDLPEALEVALHGVRRAVDVGVLNDERFVVMAGAGFDAVMIEGADGTLKKRFGRLAYVWTGARATTESARNVKIKVDGERWFKGKAGCVLIGNMGTLVGGIEAFSDADPADGLLELGVVTADSAVEWARVLARLAVGSAERSPLTRMTQAREIDVRFDEPVRYELDGGDRSKAKRLEARIEPGAVIVSVPA